MTEKRSLRQQLLKQRQAMTTGAWQDKSKTICQYLQRSAAIQAARTILAYVSIRQEPDLMPLLHGLCLPASPQRDRPSPSTAHHHAPILGLPRCQGPVLHWHQWHPYHSPPLQSGQYNIPEPASTWPSIPPQSLTPQDVMLVPAVACDRHGYRLGYGGGFYDRLLSTEPWNRMITIGIVFEMAYVERLPTEPWDCPLNAVCTESGLVPLASGTL